MKYAVLFILLSTLGCTTMGPVKSALSSDDVKINRVMKDLPSHEVQVFFSEVVRDKNDKVSFKEDQFQVDDNTYFYPASSVKLPIAILALEKLNEHKLLNRNTTYQVEGDSIISSFAKDITDIFAVSSNAASNRLFEFLGQDDINRRLNAKGISARISHRLSTPNSDDLVTKSISFYKGEEIIFKTEPINNLSISPLHLNLIKKGLGYTVSDSLVNQPMDFSDKNYLPISSLHGILKRLIFPELFPKDQQFHVKEDDRHFLIQAMGILPREAGYTTEEYYDSYGKFLVIGDSKNPIPEHLKIYNKVGYAYGYLTDCAYIVDSKTKKEYLITATIHVNKNRIYNDGIYEYDTVGIPFLAALGRQLVLEGH
ncbi:serine hydrolase [Gelidibacter sp.]|uniref:serine hydrolase n=1 Tax=Gelidibacter sp. TaxID=2018083 RepID=UPI002B7131EF|nr:serine hydrolase [Gelidibacter sp.]HUH29476.1 serine hydrolase [Gelidibacter sp.]